MNEMFPVTKVHVSKYYIATKPYTESFGCAIVCAVNDLLKEGYRASANPWTLSIVSESGHFRRLQEMPLENGQGESNYQEDNPEGFTLELRINPKYLKEDDLSFL